MLAAQGVSAVEFEGRLVLADEQRQRIVVLNETAHILWDMLQAGIDASEMASLLAHGYGIDDDIVRADVAAILSQWRAMGLLAWHEGSRTPAPAPLAAAAPLPTGDGRGRRVRRGFRVQGVYCFNGLACSLRFEDAGIGSKIHQLLAHAETRRAATHQLELVRERGQHVLLHNGKELYREGSAQRAAGLVVRALCDLRYPQADWLLFIHGAAVTGRGAVVLAGPSGSGKSTVTAALVRAGLTYFSDDVVPLDRHTLRVVPVPFRISLKEGSWRLLAARCPELARLPVHENDGRKEKYLRPPAGRSRRPSGGAPVKHLVFLHFQPDRTMLLRPLPPLQALVKLIETDCALPLDRAGLNVLLHWLKNVRSHELNYSTLDEAVEKVLRLSYD